jgi:anti-sigma factor RsiW
MQCLEFEERMHSLLDSRLKPEDDPQLQSHAACCASCEQMLHDQQRLFRVLQHDAAGIAARSQRKSADLAPQVVRRHASDQAAQVRFRRQLTWGLVFTSALSFGWLALSGQFSFRRAPTTPQPAQPLVAQPAPATHLALPAAKPAFDRRKTEEKFGQYRETIVSLAHQIGESSQLDDVGATLEPGLRPLQSSFGLAIDALRRTFPRGREERSNRPKDGAFKWLDMPILM